MMVYLCHEFMMVSLVLIIKISHWPSIFSRAACDRQYCSERINTALVHRGLSTKAQQIFIASTCRFNKSPLSKVKELSLKKLM